MQKFISTIESSLNLFSPFSFSSIKKKIFINHTCTWSDKNEYQCKSKKKEEIYGCKCVK